MQERVEAICAFGAVLSVRLFTVLKLLSQEGRIYNNLDRRYPDEYIPYINLSSCEVYSDIRLYDRHIYFPLSLGNEIGETLSMQGQAVSQSYEWKVSQINLRISCIEPLCDSTRQSAFNHPVLFRFIEKGRVCLKLRCHKDMVELIPWSPEELERCAEIKAHGLSSPCEGAVKSCPLISCQPLDQGCNKVTHDLILGFVFDVINLSACLIPDNNKGIFGKSDLRKAILFDKTLQHTLFQ